MIDGEPNLVTSSKSQRVIVGGYAFMIELHRLETEKTWTLEVVDREGASHIWDEPFSSDMDARTAALQEIEAGGAATAPMSGPPSTGTCQNRAQAVENDTLNDNRTERRPAAMETRPDPRTSFYSSN